MYLFAGEARDDATGLDYLRARWMDTGVGRFVSRDSFEGFQQNPITLHRYLYGNANPVNVIDPSGQIGVFGLFLGFVGIISTSAFLFPQVPIGAASDGVSLFLDGLIPGLADTDEERALRSQFPVFAAKVKLAAIVAAQTTRIFYFNARRYLDNGDAFRHAYWNAIMVRVVGAIFAEKFATAHEADSTGNDKVMDLWNNELGRNIGQSGAPHLSLEVFRRIGAGEGKRCNIPHVSCPQLIPTDDSESIFSF